MTVITSFDWENLCFICGDCCNIDKKIPVKYRKSISAVTDEDIVPRILSKLEFYGICEFKDVYSRLHKVESLTELKGKYHKICYSNLIMKCSYVRKRESKSPTDEAMEYVYDFIDNNPDCQFKLTELLEVIECEYVPDRSTVSAKLQDHYGDDITISTAYGARSVVQFKWKQDLILNEKWYEEQKKK